MNVTALTEFVVVVLVAFPVFSLWFTVVSVLVRPFGLRLPLTPFSWAKQRSALQALNFPQYLIVVGVLSSGGGMLIVCTLWDYLEWKYWHGSSFTRYEILSSFLTGVLIGIVSWSSLGGKRTKA